MADSIKNGGTRYDWLPLKVEYICTDISLRKLAAKYGIRTATVTKRAREERWFSAKADFRADCIFKAMTKVSTKNTCMVDDYDLEVIEYIKDINQFRQEITEERMKLQRLNNKRY